MSKCQGYTYRVYRDIMSKVEFRDIMSIKIGK